MAATPGPTDLSALLQARDIGLATLGAGYLLLLGTVCTTIMAFAGARHLLIVAPNRGTRDYATYTSVTVAAVLIATVLENESLPSGTASMHYTLVPQLLMLLGLHLLISRRQEPWLVTLGATATAATVVSGSAAGLLIELGPAYWIALATLTGLLVFLWRKAVSTQHGFLSASIYVRSKETPGVRTPRQKPWLGLRQWAALVAASVALAAGNSLLRGRGLEEIPITEVVTQSALLLLATALVAAVPAGTYWLTRKAWMPELTRFVWLAWIIVGFALTYDTYLNSLTGT